MTELAEGQWDAKAVEVVLQRFGKSSPRRIEPLGGTAAPKFLVEGPWGRMVVRVRLDEFADERLVRFDHECLLRLADAGLPVPRPQIASDGNTWVIADGQTVELLCWVEGTAAAPDDMLAVKNVGRFLARFHTAIGSDFPAGKEDFIREDHPDLLVKYIQRLKAQATNEKQLTAVAQIQRQQDRVRAELDSGLYEQLPKAVIHGDVHQGNMAFTDSDVSAVYDFDYMSVQARARDLCDALMFFAGDRQNTLDVDDIRSLVQPFELNMQRAVALLEGYQSTSVELSQSDEGQIGRLQDLDWQALPLIMRSQWCQIRLRGSRKIPPEEAVEFATDNFLDVIDWLDRSATGFFDHLRQQVSAK